jgi:hypothetical protein
MWVNLRRSPHHWVKIVESAGSYLRVVILLTKAISKNFAILGEIYPLFH